MGSQLLRTDTQHSLNLTLYYSAYLALKEQRCKNIETKAMSVMQFEIVLPVRKIQLERYTCLLYGVDRIYVHREKTFSEFQTEIRSSKDKALAINIECEKY